MSQATHDERALPVHLRGDPININPNHAPLMN